MFIYTVAYAWVQVYYIQTWFTGADNDSIANP